MVARRFFFPVVFALMPSAIACSGASEPGEPVEPSSPLPRRTTPAEENTATNNSGPQKVDGLARERQVALLNEDGIPTTEPKEDSATIADASLTPDALRARTALNRKSVLDASGAVRVNYKPDAEYDPDVPNDVSFEAIQFAGSDVPSDVHVEGDFPSHAVVLVTDEHFNVLGAALTQKAGTNPAVASVKVAGSGVRLVLVRDLRWVKPMTFDVHVR